MSWSVCLFAVAIGLSIIFDLCKELFKDWKLYRTTKNGLVRILVILAIVLFVIYSIMNIVMQLLFEKKFEQIDLIYLIAWGFLLVFSFIAIFVFTKLKSAPEKNAPNQLQDQNSDFTKRSKT